MRGWLAIAVLALVACGDEEAAPPPGAQQPAVPVAPGGGVTPPAQQNDPNKKVLVPQLRIEDQVSCMVPEKVEAGTKTCDPKVPKCPDQTYCLPIGGANYCYPCPERSAIRHEFKDRDFVVDQNNRDPFQSFVVSQGTTQNDPNRNIVKTPRCLRDDQLVATNYSYSDLKLVGIVAQGTQRKVLMMDNGNFGHIIKRGDCVGKEKAIVKDIGNGYMTFLLEQDETATSAARSEEHSVQLYPNQLPVTSQPTDDAPALRNDTPVVAPSALPSKNGAPPAEQSPPR
ncbi:MAG: hypothetical protein AB7O24_03140 [Kofleriaceae bacterium]